jgi:hypothetical protein
MRLRSFVLFGLTSLLLMLVSGCPGGVPCDFPVRCFERCGGPEISACGACPAGTRSFFSCVDLGPADAGPSDAGSDASVDASVADAGDAALPDAALVCDRPGYPASSAATADERAAVETAAADFLASTGVTAGLSATTAAVTDFSAPFPIALDAGITDPCARALAAVQAFAAARAALMRLPTDMAMRACSYDSLTDSEIVRLHGGTYAGRSLLGADNDLVVHVTRSGTIRYWGGDYLPVANRLIPTACLDAAALESSLVGASLGYTRFAACVVGAPGSVPIAASDTRTAGPSSLYVDAGGLIHIARQVEVLLDPAHVSSTEIGSDLYCCAGASLAGCVGSYLIVDEVDGTVLQQLPRCITC